MGCLGTRGSWPSLQRGGAEGPLWPCPVPCTRAGFALPSPLGLLCSSVPRSLSPKIPQDTDSILFYPEFLGERLFPLNQESTPCPIRSAGEGWQKKTWLPGAHNCDPKGQGRGNLMIWDDNPEYVHYMWTLFLFFPTFCLGPFMHLSSQVSTNTVLLFASYFP